MIKNDARTDHKPGYALEYTHPTDLFIEITSKCNMRCKYCYVNEGSRGKVNTDISVEDIRNVLVPQIREAGMTSLCFIGGEPLLRVDDIIDLAPDINKIKSVREIFIATNGYFLTEDVYKRLMRAYRDKIVYFGIPLDSLDENIVKENRPPKDDVFKRTMDAINLLKRKHAIFTIETVATKDTIDTLEDFILWVKSLGRNVGLELFTYYPQRGDEFDGMRLSDDELRRVDYLRLKYRGDPILPWDSMPCPYDEKTVKKLKPLFGKYHVISRGCTAGNKTFVVSSNGDILPCTYLREPVLGNIFETTIMDVYENHPIVKKLRNREINGKCGGCSHLIECGGCRVRALNETGDMFGGVESCEVVDGKHVHAEMVNEKLRGSGMRYLTEIMLFDAWTKLKSFFKYTRDKK